MTWTNPNRRMTSAELLRALINLPWAASLFGPVKLQRP